MKKTMRMLTLVLAAALILSLTCISAFADGISFNTTSNSGKTLPTGKACEGEDEDDEGSWAIYWYICGADLESDPDIGGAATDNIEQLTWVDLPENVTFVLETGGAKAWHNKQMDPTKLQRWVYDNNGFNLVDEQPTDDMGSEDTLADFLDFAYTNYPADKIAVIFWDHGGGSLGGCCYDENFYDDSLKLDEMHDAIASVWTPDVDNPPLELVGFDACLMSTIDTAYNFCDLAHYMVASEETEPGNGWTYSTWAQALAENPGMKGKELGTAICDSFEDGCKYFGTDFKTTLACTDLNKIGSLVEAYQNFAKEALIRMATDDGYAMDFVRSARLCENYGGNSRLEGYYDLVDLGCIAENNVDCLNSAQTILDELQNCVVYKVGGRGRQSGHGLAFYYSYDGYEPEMERYRDELVLDDNYVSIYEYMTTGELDDNAQAILDEEGITMGELQKPLTLDETGWVHIVPELASNGTTYLNLGPDAKDCLSGVYYELYWYDEDYDFVAYLGSDDTLSYDWENGIFADQFDGAWGQIDGHIMYMDITDQGDDYDLYSVPILLNGDYKILNVVYYHGQGWEILGVVEPADEHGMASRDIQQLEIGDEITPIWYTATLTGQDKFSQQEMKPFTVTADTTFSYANIGDGTYYMIYELQDFYYDIAQSAAVYFDCEDGNIHVTITGE